MSPEELSALSPKALDAYISSLSVDELLQHLSKMSGSLLELVKNIPDWVDQGIELRLADDKSSAQEASALIERASTGGGDHVANRSK